MQEILIGILLTAQLNIMTAPTELHAVSPSNNGDLFLKIKYNLLKNIEKIDGIDYFGNGRFH